MLGRRVILLAFALAFALLAIAALRTGKVKPRRGASVLREKNAVFYWMVVGIYISGAVIALCCVMRS